MNERSMDVSRLSVNVVMVGALLFTAAKVGGVGEGIRRDLKDLKGAVESVKTEATKAHDDAEAVLRDGAGVRSRLDSLEHWKAIEDSRFKAEWAFVHGRIDKFPWHRPLTPLPSSEE